MATSSIFVTPGDGSKKAATHSFTEDAVTKELQRIVSNTPAGVDQTFGAGNVSAGTPRVTHASNDPAVVALEALAEVVNLIPSQAGVTGNAGNVASNTLRVVEADDSPATAALAAIQTAVESAEPTAVKGDSFEVFVTLTVANTTHTAGDVVGGLITFAAVARANDEPVMITGAQIIVNTAITPNLLLHLYNELPTTIADDAAYSLDSSNVRKSIGTIDLRDGTWIDHGTPNSIRIDNVNIVSRPVSGTDDLYGYLQDLTGVVWGANGAAVRLRGIRL